MLIAEGSNCLEAWRCAARTIYGHRGHACNLLVTVDDPTILLEDWIQDFDPRKTLPRGDNIQSVINTVFPYKLRNRAATRHDLYSSYLSIHDRARKIPRYRGGWGTYFRRLVDFDMDGESNQLETAIRKLNSWNRRCTTGLVFHLSAPTLGCGLN